MCSVCGGGDAWIKTVRDGEGNTFPVCDPCYLVYQAEVVIVPGPIVVWGRCLSCGEWKNPRELVDMKQGAAGRGDAPGGTCTLCGQKV
jgi:hypothetical protein